MFCSRHTHKCICAPRKTKHKAWMKESPHSVRFAQTKVKTQGEDTHRHERRQQGRGFSRDEENKERTFDDGYDDEDDEGLDFLACDEFLSLTCFCPECLSSFLLLSSSLSSSSSPSLLSLPVKFFCLPND